MINVNLQFVLFPLFALNMHKPHIQTLNRSIRASPKESYAIICKCPQFTCHSLLLDTMLYRQAHCVIRNIFPYPIAAVARSEKHISSQHWQNTYLGLPSRINKTNIEERRHVAFVFVRYNQQKLLFRATSHTSVYHSILIKKATWHFSWGGIKSPNRKWYTSQIMVLQNIVVFIRASNCLKRVPGIILKRTIEPLNIELKV